MGFSNWGVKIVLPGTNATQLVLGESFDANVGIRAHDAAENLRFYSQCDEEDGFQNAEVDKTQGVFLSGRQSFQTTSRSETFLFGGIEGNEQSSSSSSSSTSASSSSSCSSSSS